MTEFTDYVRAFLALDFRNGKDWSEVADPEGDFPVYGSGGAFGRANRYLYDGEAVLFGRKGTLDRPLYVNEKFWTVDTMYYATPKSGFDGKFLYYWARTIPFNLISTQTAIPSMTSSDLGRQKVPYLTLENQRRIADYLDKEISEMDALIEEFEGLVGNLKYRKKRFVESEFQKSETWNLVPQRLKLLVDSEDNLRVPIDSGDRKDIQGKYPYYGASGVIDYVNDYIWDNEKRLLVSEDGANLIMRNHPIAFVVDGQYWVNNHAHVLKPRNDYPAELLAAAIEISPIHHLITGSAQPKLTAFSMGEIAFPFPEDADSAISMNDFIQEELSRLDALIGESTRLIENLKARKTALITEVVTGRKEV